MSHWPPALESHALSVPVQLVASASARLIQNRGLERKIEAWTREEEKGQTVFEWSGESAMTSEARIRLRTKDDGNDENCGLVAGFGPDCAPDS